MRFLTSRTLRYIGRRAAELGRNFANGGRPYEERKGGRAWEEYYRRRGRHAKVMRPTHGVTCTGSCFFDVFVNDGIIVWEAQKTIIPPSIPIFPMTSSGAVRMLRKGSSAGIISKGNSRCPTGPARAWRYPADPWGRASERAARGTLSCPQTMGRDFHARHVPACSPMLAHLPRLHFRPPFPEIFLYAAVAA